RADNASGPAPRGVSPRSAGPPAPVSAASPLGAARRLERLAAGLCLAVDAVPEPQRRRVQPHLRLLVDAETVFPRRFRAGTQRKPSCAAGAEGETVQPKGQVTEQLVEGDAADLLRVDNNVFAPPLEAHALSRVQVRITPDDHNTCVLDRALAKPR